MLTGILKKTVKINIKDNNSSLECTGSNFVIIDRSTRSGTSTGTTWLQKLHASHHKFEQAMRYQRFYDCMLGQNYGVGEKN